MGTVVASEAPTPMSEPPKVVDRAGGKPHAPRAERDHGMVFVVGIRLIQLVIILVLWLIMR